MIRIFILIVAVTSIVYVMFSGGVVDSRAGAVI